MLSFAIMNDDRTLIKHIMQSRYIDLKSILRYGLATTKVVQPERLIDVKSNYQNLILVSLGIKNDSANRNYLVTRILGWPKGAPILKDYLIGIG